MTDTLETLAEWFRTYNGADFYTEWVRRHDEAGVSLQQVQRAICERHGEVCKICLEPYLPSAIMVGENKCWGCRGVATSPEFSPPF